MKFRIFTVVILVLCIHEVLARGLQNLIRAGVLDLNFFRCLIKDTNICPHQDINFFMHTTKHPRGTFISVKNPFSLFAAGFNSKKETAFIIHGFNGTVRDEHMMYLRDAYVSRDYNVISVDWRPLTQYPCYLSALVNTRLAAQCSAQIYAFLTHHGAEPEKITCIGHSLGAHICGMMSNHLTKKQYRIIGLDPARPLVERKKSSRFRLTRDDAKVVQVIHTNAGYLGQADNPGDLNYCVNGGKLQPYCKGHPIRRSRCSHFLSVCYLANAMFKHKKFLGVPCPNGCVSLSGPKRLPVSTKNPFDTYKLVSDFRIGNDAPDEATGVFCIDVEFAKHCPFGDIRS